MPRPPNLMLSPEHRNVPSTTRRRDVNALASLDRLLGSDPVDTRRKVMGRLQIGHIGRFADDQQRPPLIIHFDTDLLGRLEAKK